MRTPNFRKSLVLPAMLSVAVLLMGSGCAESRPAIKTVDARVTGIDWRGVTLAFDLGVKNPLPIALSAPGGRFAIDIGENELLRSDNIPAIAVAARDTGTVTLPARLEYGQILAMATGMRDLAEIPYRLRGALAFRVAGAPLELPFEHRGELPVLKMPKIEIEDFESSGFSMQGASITVDAEIENPNAFALGVADLGYVLSIGGVQVGEIAAKTPNRIASKSNGKLQLRGTISTAQAISGILSNRDLSAVKLNLTGTLDTPFGDVGVLP
ncbi:MAG: LEA type 2 family protein [Phycisphaerales bacterium]|nr:LEA type 2 family protein [Phycisphaerales bacterium]